MLMLFLFSARQHVFAATDTTYFKSYYNKAVIRLVQTYRTQDFYFSSNSAGIATTNSFQTGNEFFIGADASYKWVNLSYSLSLSPNESRHNSSGQLSTAYKALRFQAGYALFQNLNYSVTRQKTGSARLDTVLSERENDIQVLTARLKVDYVFNYRRYGYSASFSQSGRQLKNAGSFIASLALTSENFFLNQLTGRPRAVFDSTYGFTTTLIGGINAGIGYGHNWVPGKHWTISVVELPNIAFQRINAQAADPELSYSNIGFVNHLRLGVAYATGKWAFGLSGYNVASTSKMRNSNYSNIYNSVDVYVGLIIDARKKLLFLF